MKRLSTGTEERIEITLFKTEVKLSMLIWLEDCIRSYKMRARSWCIFCQEGIIVQNSHRSIFNIRNEKK